MTKKSTLAKLDNGTIQVTFTLSWKDVSTVQNQVLEEEGQKVTIPGFRKGKAPLSKVKEKVSSQVVIEHTLNHFYSFIISEIINTHKVKPAIYPRLEILKAIDEEDWEIRATTCELPQFELGDYRKLVLDNVKQEKVQTPKPQKEQAILKTLVENIKITIPALLVDEEVNQRLSELLARIEKLGLQLESYLTQIGKNPQTLREEYIAQAKSAISIELILGKIANTQGIKAEESEVDSAIKAASAGQVEVEKKLNTPKQRNIIKNVLQRRTVLESLVALI